MSLGLRHAVKRRRARVGAFPTPRSLLQNALDVLIYPVAFAAPMALIPQVWQLYTTHNAAGLSLPSWVLLGTFNLMWIFYGVVHRARPVVYGNVLFGAFNFAVVLGIILFR